MANPGPARNRIMKKLNKSFQEILNPHEKETSGTQGPAKRRLGKKHFPGRIAIHRKGANYQSKQSQRKNWKKGNDMNISETAQIIISKHGTNIQQLLEQINPTHASIISKQLIKTCLQGWTYNNHSDIYQYKDNSFSVSGEMFTINEDSSLKPVNNIQLNYDWLYELATQADTMNESYGDTVQELDITRTADALNNAAKTLKGLNNDKIHGYILDTVPKEKQSMINTALSEQAANWKLNKITMDGSTIHIIIDTKYTEDGTQSGVQTKTLKIIIKPGDEVQEINTHI